MDKQEIKGVLSEVQKKLDSLQNEGATFLFVGDEGNHFTISGNPTHIIAQIIFAMIRYPIVKNIIFACASRFDEMNKAYGSDVKNVKMEHLIEQNSGNKN